MPLRSQPPTANRQYLIWVGSGPRHDIGGSVLRWLGGGMKTMGAQRETGDRMISWGLQVGT